MVLLKVLLVMALTFSILSQRRGFLSEDLEAIFLFAIALLAALVKRALLGIPAGRYLIGTGLIFDTVGLISLSTAPHAEILTTCLLWQIPLLLVYLDNLAIETCDAALQTKNKQVYYGLGCLVGVPIIALFVFLFLRIYARSETLVVVTSAVLGLAGVAALLYTLGNFWLLLSRATDAYSHYLKSNQGDDVPLSVA